MAWLRTHAGRRRRTGRDPRRQRRARHDRAVGTAGARHPGGGGRLDDVGDAAIPMRRARTVRVGPAPVLAARISYAGELGWELTTDADWAVGGLGSPSRRPARTHGLEPVGYRALDALRMEKGYRYFGTDLTMLDTPDEAGLGPFVRLDGGPVRRSRCARRRARGAPGWTVAPPADGRSSARARLPARLRRRGRPPRRRRSSAASAASPTGRPSSARSATPTCRLGSPRASPSRSTSSIGGSAPSWRADVLVDPTGVGCAASAPASRRDRSIHRWPGRFVRHRIAAERVTDRRITGRLGRVWVDPSRRRAPARRPAARPVEDEWTWPTRRHPRSEAAAEGTATS